MYGITGLGSAADYYVMDSSQKADKVIQAFEAAIMAGYHPNDVEQKIYAETGVDPSDFTMTDKRRIQRTVEEIYKSFTQGRRY